MAISVIDNFTVNTTKNIDSRLGPYASVAEATGSISTLLRYVGMTVTITGSGAPVEYWFSPTTASTDLVLKTSPSSSFASSSLSSSYALTASYVQIAQTASYVLSSSYAATASVAPLYLPLTGGTITGNITINGTASINYLNVVYETASVIYSSGSNQFGDASNDTQSLYGSVIIPTGSLTITGSTISTAGFTGSLQGTSSWANNASTASYVVTAQTASYVQNAQTASYVLQAVSASYATLAQTANTASYVNPLRQTVQITGSLTTTGSNTLIGNTSLTGSLNVSGSTTQVGNNALYGNTTLSGSLIISGAQGTTTPNIQIFGDINQTGYTRYLPINSNIDPAISASYIYVSGSTNDLYFSQNGAGYSNTTRLRWLEGNLYTGLLDGGLVTQVNSTTYQVASGSGIIVNLNASFNDNPYPTVQYINWGNVTNTINALSASYDQSFIAISSSGQIYAQGYPLTDGQVDDYIPVGVVLHQNHSSINGVVTQPSVAYGWKQRSNVFIAAFGPLKLSGYLLSPSGSSTGSLVVGDGTAFLDGGNYQTNPNNPAYVTGTGATTSRIFRYYDSGSVWAYDTNNGTGYGAIDPTKYSNNGVLTAVPGTGANRQWSIQRCFFFPTSPLNPKPIVVYYGNASYTTQVDAIANITVESFTEAPNTAANAIYLGSLVVRNNADFTDSTSYKFIPGGLFRAVGGSGGGTTVTNTLAGLSDVSITSPTYGDLLMYDTTVWNNTKTLSGSYTLSGSLNVSGSLTGSLLGTASYAATASYSANGGVTQLIAGANISLSPANGLGQVTVSSTGGGGGYNTATGSYGSFYDTTTQTNPVANINRSMSLNTTDISNGVSISGSTSPYNTYIKTTNAGVYNIQFSAQLEKTSLGGTSTTYIWLRKNGGDLIETNTIVELSQNGKGVAAWNWFVNAAANDYYQIMWSSNATDIQLAASTPAYGPTVPSVIVTANRVDQFLSNTGSFSGSFNGVFSGSLYGTASYATNAISASTSLTASDIYPAITNNYPDYVLLTTGTGKINGSTNFAYDNAISGFRITDNNLIIGDLTSVITIGSSGNSFAQGSSATVNGYNAYAQGSNVTAHGNNSHAEGQSTVATGIGSHAEGSNTTASGSYSHAEGLNTTASGSYSHAEGYFTRAIGNYSHAEGSSTTALGIYSHAEGTNTTASGIYSHAEGAGTAASGSYSHAEGRSTTTVGSYSHAEGFSTTASGSHSHAEGRLTTAVGDYSHTEGRSTTASGDYSHAEGQNTITISNYQHAQGIYNLPTSGAGAFILGNGTDDLNRSNLIFASGSLVQVTGSVIATQGFTGSLFGTASRANSATSSSYALTASYALNGGSGNTFPYTGSALITGSLGITGSLSVSQSLDTSARTLLIPGGIAVLHWNDLALYDYNASSSLAWSERILSDIYSINSANWGDRLLYDASGIPVMNWGTTTLYDDTTQESLVWGARVLLDEGGWSSLNWNDRTLFDSSEIRSIDWQSRTLKDISGSTNIDWSVPGNVTTQRLYVSGAITGTNGLTLLGGNITTTGFVSASLGFTGSLFGTASRANSATSSSYALTASYALNGGSGNTFPYTGSALITGSLGITGSLSVSQSLDTSARTLLIPGGIAVLHWNDLTLNGYNASSSLNWGGRTLYDSDNTEAAAWNVRLLFDEGGNTSLDWAGRILIDSSGIIQSVDWSNRTLYNSGQTPIIQWDDYLIYDQNGTSSIDWSNRRLNNIKGDTVLSWAGNSTYFGTPTGLQIDIKGNTTATGSITATQGFTGSLFGTASWASNATSASYALTASYALNAAGGSSTQIATGSVTASVSPTQFSVVSGSSTEFVVTGTGVTIGNAVTDTHIITGSLTITGSLIMTGSLYGRVVDITPNNQTASLNCALGNIFTLTLSGSRNTILTASNIQPGQSINLRIVQPNPSGSLSYGSQFKFPNGLPYTASATSSVTDIVSFITFDSTTLYGTSLKNFI